LKRRNVYKVAVAYAVVAWLLIQIATQVFPFFEIPNWAVRLIVLLLILGFPVALVLSWVFEITPEGIKRESEIERGKSIRPQTGRRIVGLTIVVAIIAAGLLAFQLLRSKSPANAVSTTIASRPAAEILAKSIAVLPFENLSDDKSNAYFASGIQEELLTRLSKIGDLKVISRTSTEKYKAPPTSLREVAQQLGVGTVLEGSVQKAADQVRVSVQLINALNDSHLWAETYDRKIADLFQVETEIAQKIAGALEAKLSGREKKDISGVGTNNSESYDAYLHGLTLSRSSMQSAVDNSIQYFRRAVELDPKFAEAWAELSIAESLKYYFPQTNEAQKERARTAMETAMRLAPDMVNTHAALGLFYYYCLKDFDRALSELQIAKERDPNNANTIFSISLVKRRQGKMDEAIALQEQAARLDPLNGDICTNLAGTYRGIRKIPEARAVFDRALSIAPNDLGVVAQKAETFLAEGNADAAWKILSAVKFPPTEFGFAITIQTLIYQRRYKDAEEILTAAWNDTSLPPLFRSFGLVGLARLRLGRGDRAGAQQLFAQVETELEKLCANGENSPFVFDVLIETEAYLGHREEVEQLAQEIMERMRSDLWEFPHQEEVIARAYFVLGDLDRAFPMLEHVLSVPYVFALTPAMLRADPDWDPIRNDPRFQKLCEDKPK
jgi:TolB-like protein/cytochrome c-type biogenesis protein CcmH/NrfG